VSAPRVIGRIGHETSGDRVEVNVRQESGQVCFAVDKLGLVSTLPERPINPMLQVDESCGSLLETLERPMQRHSAHPHGQVEVI